eukprot:2976238-Amphidinium_carterae.1
MIVSFLAIGSGLLYYVKSRRRSRSREVVWRGDAEDDAVLVHLDSPSEVSDAESSTKKDWSVARMTFVHA